MRRTVAILALLLATIALSACEDADLDAFLDLYDVVDYSDSEDPELQKADEVLRARDDWRRSHIELEEWQREFNRIMSDPERSFSQRTIDAEDAFGDSKVFLENGDSKALLENPIYEHSRLAVLYAFGGDELSRDDATVKLIEAETAAQAGGPGGVDPACVANNVTRHLYEAQAETLDALHPGWASTPPGSGASSEARRLYEFHMNADYPAPCDG